MTLLSVAVALVSSRYVLGKGPVPETISANRHYHPWLVIHAGAAAAALLVGPLQFLPTLRRRRPGVHRAIGRLYVAGCTVGGITGLILATGVWAGPVARAGFLGLSSAWLLTTAIGVHRITLGRVASHRRWMIRSFALTLSAVTLRLYLPLSVLLGLDITASYRFVAWACWLPNMFVAELCLRRGLLAPT